MGLIAISSMTTLEQPDPDASELTVDWVVWLLEDVIFVSVFDSSSNSSLFHMLTCSPVLAGHAIFQGHWPGLSHHNRKCCLLAIQS